MAMQRKAMKSLATLGNKCLINNADNSAGFDTATSLSTLNSRLRGNLKRLSFKKPRRYQKGLRPGKN